MKKLKWFILIIMIFLAAVFLFATCKKTNALEVNYHNQYQTITRTDNNSGYAALYLPNFNEINNNMTTFLCTYPTGYFSLDIYKVSNAYQLRLRYEGVNKLSINLTSDCIGFYVIIGCYDYTTITNENLFLDIVILNADRTTGLINTIDNYYYFSNLAGQEYDDFLDQYQTARGIDIYYSYYNANYGEEYKGAFNYFTFDILDYSDTASEQAGEIIAELNEQINNNFIYHFQQACYNLGYVLGNQEGYDDGYANGETAGYNEGVNDNAAGQQIAYDRGYDAGLQDGYLPAYNSGYSRGYDVGLQEGIDGATPVSQTVTLLGSIFGAIGTVLSIQLFPGFSLGIIILVPLFFAVLGLILWIWRRN